MKREVLSPQTRETLWSAGLMFVVSAAISSIVVVALTAPRQPSVQSTSRFDNVEVAGTTDATGVVTARAGVRLTAPSTGPIFTSGTGVPTLSATKGSLYLRTDTAGMYQNTNGSTAWSAIGAGGITGSGTANQIAKFSGTTTLANSLIADDGINIYGAGDSFLSLDTTTGTRYLNIGRDATSTNATFNGFKLTANTDGNNYFDSKVRTSGTMNYRLGAGTSPGSSILYETVSSTGVANFPVGLQVGGVPVATGSSGGGYQGSWAAGAYSAGAIVKCGSGPFATFGARVATSQAPCTDFGSAGSAASWTVMTGTAGGNSLDSTNKIMTLVGNATGGNAGYVSTTTVTGWEGRRLIVDALVSAPGGADGFNFGIYDSTLGTPAANGGCANLTGFYGAEVDIWNSRIRSLANTVVQTSTTYYNNGSIYSQGDDPAVVTYGYQRFYLDLIDAGATMSMNLYRDNYIGCGDTQACPPGLMAKFTGITKPSFSTWRFCIGGRSGGVTGTFKVRDYPYATFQPGAGDWDVLSEYRHTPRLGAGMY